MSDHVPAYEGGGIWTERLYKAADKYDNDCQFFENALKSSHVEGKMSAREMTFAKGQGLPVYTGIPGTSPGGS